MAVLGKFTQTSIEEKKYGIDYSQWLEPGETLISFTWGYSPVATPPAVFAGTINGDGLGMTAFLSGGVNGGQYKILVAVRTSAGQRKEDEIILAVRDY